LGGIGKTRVVAEFARRHAGLFPDGVWFVDLSELEADADVAPFACDVLRELAPLACSLEDLAAAVADRHALIVFDGCDRVREAAARFAAALPTSDIPVRVLATAHEAFGIVGEHVHGLGPLALADGVELLVDRARDAGAYVDEARQATMAAIVQHLDALPLAIELAAPQLRTLAPNDLLAQIDQGLAAFDRTVDAVFDWSRRLLDFDEERVFRRLAIFAGQFTIEGAIRVCALDADRNEATIASAVERLAAKSLISRDASVTPPRFSHLEIGRLYAQRLLIEAGEFETSSEAFVRYHVALAERLEGALGMMPAAAWYELVEADAQNIRYALAVALEWGLLEEAAIICRCIHTWFLERGALVTGDLRDRLAAALDTSDLPPSTEGALALALAALLRTDEPAVAYDLARRAYDCYRAARDPLRIADALRSIVSTELQVTGRVDPSIDEELLEAIDASLEFGSTIRAAELLNNLGVAYAQDEEPSRLHDALECFERSTALLDARGDRDRSGRVIGNAAAVAFFLGDLKLAVRRSGQAVEILERARAMPSSARQLANHGYYLFTDRRFDEARDALLRALAQLRDVNDRSGLVSAFEYLALFAHARGDDLRALRFFGFADTLLGSKFVRQARKADLLEPVMAQIRRNVGDELFEATMRLGATLSLEQAVQEAYD
jgi:predicted ATPase